jgi:hypothetical protein
LGELVDVAVRRAEVDPGVAAVVDLRLEQDLDPAERSSAVAWWRSSTRNPATGPV